MSEIKSQTWAEIQKEEYEKGEPRKINFLKTIGLTQSYMQKYYEEAYQKQAEGTAHIAWVTSSVPFEVIFAFENVYPFLPEYSGVQAAFAKTSTKYQLAAERHGYDIELCSVFRTHLGENILNRTKEEGAIPRPDFLIVTRHMCHCMGPAWDAYQRRFNIPIHRQELPYFPGPELDTPLADHHKKYYAESLRSLVKFLEEQTGQKFDKDRYKEVVKLSNRVRNIWIKILEYGKKVPCPYSDWDLYVPLLAIGNWRGTQMAVDLFEEVIKEVEYRAKNNIGALPNEKFRLFFNGNPSWYNFQFLPAILAAKGAIFVCSETNYLFTDWTNAGSGDFEEMADNFVRNYLNMGIKQKIEYDRRLCKEYQVDGAIFQDNRGCRPFVFGFYDVIDTLEKEGIPCLLYESNSADLRFWSDEEIRSKLTTFIEILEQRRKVA